MDKIKTRLTIFAICEVLLIIAFVVFRFVLFDMHGMKEWPLDLFAVGSILCLAGAMIKGYFTCTFTVVGYILGFAIATNFMPKGEGVWLIWLVIFVCSAVFGIVIDIFTKIKGKK